MSLELERLLELAFLKSKWRELHNMEFNLGLQVEYQSLKSQIESKLKPTKGG